MRMEEYKKTNAAVSETVPMNTVDTVDAETVHVGKIERADGGTIAVPPSHMPMEEHKKKVATASETVPMDAAREGGSAV